MEPYEKTQDFSFFLHLAVIRFLVSYQKVYQILLGPLPVIQQARGKYIHVYDLLSLA